uniref:DNA pilot protein n=1 Tax=Dulem virus 99 TaxID=3145810 RepID=A0AAU8AUA8_9VIRU
MSFLNFLPVIGPAVSGLIGGIFNSASQNSANQANLQAVRETNQANRELAQYNWEQQVKMWHDNNAYNSPSAQMNRFREAGLNPHLIYGQGSNGNSTSTPTPQLPTMEAGRVESLRYGDAFQGIGDAVATYLNLKKIKNETDLAESQVAAQSVENRLKLMDMQLKFEQMQGQRYDNKYKADLFPYNLKAATLAVTKSEQDIERGSSQLVTMGLEQEMLRKGIVKSDQELENMKQLYRKMATDMAESYSRMMVNQSNVRLNNAKIWGISIDNRFKFSTLEQRKELFYEELLKATLNNDSSVLHYIDDYNTGTASDVRKAAWQRAARGDHSNSSNVAPIPSFGFTPRKYRW